MARLHPHNSISNVVASVTTHDNLYVYIYIYIFIYIYIYIYIYLFIYLFERDVAKNMKPLWKIKGFFNRTLWKVSDVQVVHYTWVLVAKDNPNRPVANSLRSVFQQSWS